jgi:hypothetical protein
MTTTFLKRQKEMKRQEKQREKAERRLQKKLAKRAGDDSMESAAGTDNDSLGADPNGISKPGSES